MGSTGASLTYQALRRHYERTFGQDGVFVVSKLAPDRGKFQSRVSMTDS